jgi:arylsulfatase A-like enzyme
MGMKSREGGRWDATKVRMYGYYYYRMVEMVDAEVGRVYDALRQSRHAENTLFIFTADHGEMLGYNNMFKKGVLYDSALRVPLTCVFPGRARAGYRDREHLVSGVDIPATILDYAGLEPMPGMTIAKSLRPLLEGTPVAWRDYLVAESYMGGPRRAVRMGDFKAVLYQDGKTRLYNMTQDPLEMQNLAADPGHAQVLDKARTLHNDYVRAITLHPEYQAFGEV